MNQSSRLAVERSTQKIRENPIAYKKRGRAEQNTNVEQFERRQLGFIGINFIAKDL